MEILGEKSFPPAVTKQKKPKHFVPMRDWNNSFYFNALWNKEEWDLWETLQSTRVSKWEECFVQCQTSVPPLISQWLLLCSYAHTEWQTRRAQPEVSGQLVLVQPLHYTPLLNLNMPNHHHYEESTLWISLNVNTEALGEGLKQNPKNLARGDTSLFRSWSWQWGLSGKLVWVHAGDTCRRSCKVGKAGRASSPSEYQ